MHVVQIKAHELRTKTKSELLTELDDLQQELAQVRPDTIIATNTLLRAGKETDLAAGRRSGNRYAHGEALAVVYVAPCRQGDRRRYVQACQDQTRPTIHRSTSH